jgi:carboxymethylenebutenolidase
MGSTIELKAADGHTLSAYTAGAADAKRALVVIQEIFGVNHHMRQVCDAFAREGYAAIAPALFDRAERGVELGYGQDDIARGRDLRGRVPDAGAIADIEAAAAHFAGARCGIVGYCWGGTIAWWGATRSHSFAAAVGWYGGGIAVTKDAPTHCPVQLHFGEKDASIPIADVEAIRAAQPGVEAFVYPGAQHGFGCDERPSYSAKDAELAQQRTLAFFARHLGG